ILAPLPSSTNCPTTRAPDSGLPICPSPPDTANISGNSTEPSVPVASFSTRITSPGATRYCFPPARMTAYIRLPPSKYLESQITKRNLRAHQRNLIGSDELPAELLVLAVFSATALQQPGQASPERVGE